VASFGPTPTGPRPSYVGGPRDIDMSKLSCCPLKPCICPPAEAPVEGLLPANTSPALTLQNTPALRVKPAFPKTSGNAERPHPTSPLQSWAPQPIQHPAAQVPWVNAHQHGFKPSPECPPAPLVSVLMVLSLP